MQQSSRLKTIGLWTITLLVSLVSFRFLGLGLETAFPDMIEHIAARKTIFLTHITASPIALALGLFQFSTKLRKKRPTVHRWMGRFYMVAILLGGVSGLVMAEGMLAERPVAGIGFGLLSLLWIGATAQAVRLAMSGKISQHRRWMIRSFALTFAAVTLRLYLPAFLFGLKVSYAEASLYLAWMCWIPNLLIAEWYLRRR